MSSEALVSAGHAFGGWNFHLQFTPAYRREPFRDPVVISVCKRVALEVAARLGVKIEASEFGPDHWHLFVSGAKNYSAPQLAQYFKGVTSLVLRRECWDKIKSMLWGDCFWSHGYFAETIGRVTSETIRYYIERQQQKHWRKHTQTRLPNYV